MKWNEWNNVLKIFTQLQHFFVIFLRPLRLKGKAKNFLDLSVISEFFLFASLPFRGKARANGFLLLSFFFARDYQDTKIESDFCGRHKRLENYFEAAEKTLQFRRSLGEIKLFSDSNVNWKSWKSRKNLRTASCFFVSELRENFSLLEDVLLLFRDVNFVYQLRQHA